MKKQLNTAIVLLGVGLLMTACAGEGTTSSDGEMSNSEAPISDISSSSNPDNSEAWSGFRIANPSTQSMQDDDFENPGMPWVDEAAEIWGTAAGASGLSCASCHGDVDDVAGGALRIPMKGVGSTYPRFDADSNKPINIELQINKCRISNQYASPFKYESDQMLGMTGLIRMQDRGVPVVSNAGDPEDELHAAWKQGEEFYFQRRGKMDMACATCHIDYEGSYARAELLSQGQSNGFPLYRLKWQKPGSLHRRFRGCNKNIRAQPYGYGSDEYLNLETYVTWRGRGLRVESPGVRK